MVSVMLVNHGESVLAREERYSGQRDTPLTAMGQAQHQRLAARLVGKRIGRVVCSDLERCRALADLIAAGRGIEVEAVPGLREASFGAWEGLTYKEVMERDRASMVAFNRNLVHVAPPGGESLRALAERARPAFDAAVRSHDRHAGALVIVTHGGTIRALLCGLLAIPLERHWTLRIDHASLTKLDLYPLGPILEVLNDTCHLRDG